MRGRLVALLALGLLASGCAGGGAFGMRRQALTSTRPGGFQVDLAADVGMTVGMAGIGILLDREKKTWALVPPCGGDKREPGPEDRAAYEALAAEDGTCVDTGIPAIDHFVIRQDSATARQWSDMALLGMVGLPYVVAGGDTGFNQLPAQNFGIDALVITETLAATLFSTSLIKTVVARPRPLTYNANVDKAERYAGDARLSFPSGHTSLSFAAASVTSVMLLERYPGDTGALLGAVGTYLGAATVGTLRILGGKHFLTDVLAGAALGTAVGLVVPLLHVRPEPEVTTGPGRAVVPIFALGGQF